MNPACGRTDRVSHIFEKRNYVMICSFLDLNDFRNGEARAFSNLDRVCLGNLAKLGHRLAGERFNLEPDLELALVRPDLAHLRSGIAINHRERRYERSGNAKTVFPKKEIAPVDKPPERL